jgi:predicted nucleotidyltransferase
MPVKSSTSSVLRWPDRHAVEAALRGWAAAEATRHPGLVRLGVFGSYARGDAGVGSDLHLVAVVEDSEEPFERRAVSWDLAALPVPAEILVYTQAEWRKLLGEGSRFAAVLRREARWLIESGPVVAKESHLARADEPR